jgi:hypothetical protein
MLNCHPKKGGTHERAKLEASASAAEKARKQKLSERAQLAARTRAHRVENDIRQVVLKLWRGT